MEPPWKKIKLSLERPYKDDNGVPIPVLLDIDPNGQHIYEPKENPTKQLGENLRRIFIERGVDFFERNGGHVLEDGTLNQESVSKDNAETEAADGDDDEATLKVMTSEELFKMRMEILPQLLCVFARNTCNEYS